MGEQEALPWDTDSSGALIYTAANPDQLHRSGRARRSPWRFPFSHRREALTPIPEIHLCPGFRVRSSTFLVCAHRLTNAGWFHHLSHGSYRWRPQQGLVCDRVPAAHPAPNRGGFPTAPSCSLLWGLPCLGQEGLNTGQGHFARKQRLANTHTGLSQGRAADFWGHPPADPPRALGDPSTRRRGAHGAVRKS